MKICVTGAQGQLAQALLRLAPQGCEVIGLNRDQLDVTNGAAIRQSFEAHRPDVVVNAAAYTAVDRAEAEPEQAHAVNTVAPAALAARCCELGARFIHVSTDFVFDGAADHPYTPGSPTNPLSVYGRTKCAGEEAVRKASGGQATIVRTAWVYGPGGKNFVGTMRRLLTEKEQVRVVADQIGVPTSTHSLSRAIYKLIESGAGVGETLHWTDAGVSSWYEFASAIRACILETSTTSACATIDAITTAEYPTPAKRPPYSVLDCAGWPEGLTRRHWRDELKQMWPLLVA